MFVIEIQKDGEGFGFSIHGGSDVGFPLRVMKIAPGKAADRDRRLLVSFSQSLVSVPKGTILLCPYLITF